MAWREHLIHSAKGFAMGAADVIPGVSGGTMALILGIYQRWIAAIHSFDKTWLKQLLRLQFRESAKHTDLIFIIPLLIGIASALLFFTRIIPLPQLLHSHPEPIYGLFFGLIIASIVLLIQQSHIKHWHSLGYIILGAALGFFIVTRVPLNTPDSALFIYLCGFIAISAMLLPGISGSFILLILHKYDTILNAIGSLNLSILIPFAFGALTGLILFSRLLTWLLKRFHQSSLLTITGILIGSLWVIWPFQQRVYIILHGKQKLLSSSPLLPESWLQIDTLFAILMAIIGFISVLYLHYLAHKNKP